MNKKKEKRKKKPSNTTCYEVEKLSFLFLTQMHKTDDKRSACSREKQAELPHAFEMPCHAIQRS